MNVIARLTLTLVIDLLNEMALKPIAPNSTVHTSDENPDRDQPLYGRLSESQQESHSIAENSNVTHIASSVDDLSRADEHIPEMPPIITGSEDCGDAFMEAVTLSNITSEHFKELIKNGIAELTSTLVIDHLSKMGTEPSSTQYHWPQRRQELR